MMARVAVASNALDLGDLPQSVSNALMETLLERLLAHGRLVFASDAEALEFVNAVKMCPGLPQGARTRWTETLLHLRRNHRVVIAQPPGTAQLADIRAVETLRAGWGTSSDIAIVAMSACKALGVPADTGVLSSPGSRPDIAMATTATNTPAFIRLNDLEQQSFAPAGSQREDFWNDVLGPLATDASVSTILDGYLLRSIAESASGRRGAGRRGARRGNEQVIWLLEHLDGVMAGGSTVRLIANRRNLAANEDAPALARAIATQWGPLNVGRLHRVEVILTDSRAGRRFPHDRHIRFDTGCAVKINAGFDRLREEQLWDPNGMWWSYHWKPSALVELRKNEQMAESLPNRSDAIALWRGQGQPIESRS